MSELPDLSHAMEELRAQFIERTWHVVCIAAVVVAPLVLARSVFLRGDLMRPLPLIGLAGCSLILYVLRHRLPPRLYPHIPPTIMILAGLSGLVAAGLQGIGVLGLIFGHISMAATHSRRAALGALFTSGLGAAAIAALYIRGVLHPAFGIEFASSPALWVGLLFTTMLLGLFMAAAMADYRRKMDQLVQAVLRQRDQIANLANHDSLTGLPVLRLARDRLVMACKRADRDGHLAAVLFVDLDGFKQVNDAYGHEAGDLVLREIAQRLQALLRASDTAARIGGDEFLVILPEIRDADDASQAAAKLVAGLAETIDIGLAQVRVGASIGIALYPEHGADGEALLRRADGAMYEVKRGGKNAYALAA
ncbi:GGDEF domain-containing protein [Massilia sp. TS11]|uniref:GGDEF domain-containing protein n=1 Tax=Massilia sp. TS11 TaxID=2908003 RepID=UPI001EDA3022|nr:GGDEF domain-containing protein [Massilia sp. TS11]MCG2586091.1 GGDEF domain-containing protein [Massilia sp. TS11]